MDHHTTDNAYDIYIYLHVMGSFGGSEVVVVVKWILVVIGEILLYVVAICGVLKVSCFMYSMYTFTMGWGSGFLYDDVIKLKHFLRYWPFVRGIHRSPANSPHIGQWRGAFMFPLICAWINAWVNNREAGDLRRYRDHYDVNVMYGGYMWCPESFTFQV